MPPNNSNQFDPTQNDGTSARVTFCVPELDPGGAEKALVRVASGLRERGWMVNVVSLRDAGSLTRQLESDGISVTALQCGSFMDIRAVFRLRRVLRREQPELLVCFLHQANIVGRLAGRLAGVRNVISGIRVADRRKWVTWTDRLTRRLTRKYVAVSRHVADVHAGACRISPDKMTVIHNGVDIPGQYPTRLRQVNSNSRILFVGRLTKQKQPMHLVRAIAAMPDQLRNQVIVDFIGEGELRRDLERHVVTAGLGDCIRFRGYQSNVVEWMQNADVLALPSAWEGLPNVVLEAMANRLPVVATNVDGVAEIIQPGVTGWLVPPADVTALAAALSQVLTDEDARQKVADRALEAVRQRFCWKNTIEAFERLLNDLRDHSHGLEKCR